MGEREKHFLRVLVVVIGLAGVILLFSSQEKTPCCPYPSTDLRPSNLSITSEVSYRDRLLEEQRLRYLERNKISCK